MAGTGGAGRGASPVQRFYDANTLQFLLFGSGQAIHRELYGPGVEKRSEALDLAHELIRTELTELGPGPYRVLDLGCGVGAAARYLAARGPIAVVGVTISRRQVALARRLSTGLAGDIAFLEADFTDLPAGLRDFDLAYSIEAFVHSPSAAAYFAAAAEALRPGGRLVIIDDVRTDVEATGDAAARALQTARNGWHYDSLHTVPVLRSVAAGAGLDLIGDRDLSALQRLGRPRDRVIHASLPVLRWLAPHNRWCQMLVGGDALQASHRAGLLAYRQLTFVRR